MKQNISISNEPEKTEFVTVPKAYLESITKKIELIYDLVLTKSQKNIISEKWLNENQAKETLGKGTTSLWALRKSKSIHSEKIGGKTYYNVESINKYLERGLSDVVTNNKK